jgi:hypothetical protein
MHRASLCAARLYEGARQNVLTAVLLQMVKPSRAVNPSLHDLTGSERADIINHVMDQAGFVFDHIDNARAVEQTCIVWLTAASRIESRAVKNHTRRLSASVYGDNGRLKFKQVRIGEVEFFCRLHDGLN